MRRNYYECCLPLVLERAGITDEPLQRMQLVATETPGAAGLHTHSAARSERGASRWSREGERARRQQCRCRETLTRERLRCNLACRKRHLNFAFLRSANVAQNIKRTHTHTHV